MGFEELEAQRRGSSLGREGWGFPAASKKAHYFVIKAGNALGESLCGKWGFWGGETEQGNDNSPDNCAECKKRLAKRRGKHG